jgi:hypothetical protein
MWHISPLYDGESTMTTPQVHLHDISRRLHSIEVALLPEDEASIFERLARIEQELKKIDRIQDQLALIIKLLGKHE